MQNQTAKKGAPIRTSDLFLASYLVNEGCTVIDAELISTAMKDPITEIQKFQIDRQLHLMEYNNFNETSLILEEIFESFGFDVPKENRDQLVNSFKSWMTTLNENGVIFYDESKINVNGDIKWEESVDSTCDQIVFLIGKLMKLEVDPKLALLEVAQEVNSRKGRLIDGKFIKFKEGEKGYEPTYKANYNKCKIGWKNG